MKRTVESIMSDMEANGAMMCTKMTKDERMAGLLDYQEMILRLVFNDDHAANLRLWDVAAHFRDLASEKGCEDTPVVAQAIEDMEIIAKEIAKAISGASGEHQVAKSLRYVRRNIIALPNISLSDGEDKTELDQVVITSNGILILEVKNYKKDIIISEAGQIYGPCNKRYSDKNLGEQMNVKRFLLRSKLEAALAAAESETPVHIESRVVFSDPNISVTDLYRQERYCFKTSLSHEIDGFQSVVYYTADQMRSIAAAISEFADKDERYDVGLDFDRIRKTFAQALILLESEPIAEETQTDAQPEIENELSSARKISGGKKVVFAIGTLAALVGIAVTVIRRK